MKRVVVRYRVKAERIEEHEALVRDVFAAPDAARPQGLAYQALKLEDALVGDDCRLDLVSKSQRRGKEVGMYFGNYEKLDVRLRVVRLEGELALAAHVDDATTPSYFILLAFEDGKVREIRDYRYVPYITNEADVTDG